MRVEIREILSHSELEACARLQVAVWGFDRLDVVSAPMLASCRARGGVLLGAFSEPGDLVGFVFSLPAWLGSRTIQHSHMLAVEDRFRDFGVGMRLKMVQRRKTLELGQDVITWTFDPLESKNGHLNLNKLRAVVRRYYVNLYGQKTSSELHSALGTDRFLAEWTLSPEPPAESAPSPGLRGLRIALQGERRAGSWAGPGRPNLGLDCARIGIEIPFAIQELKAVSLETAMQWRLASREALSHYLKSGYEVTRLRREGEGSEARSFYELARSGVHSAEPGAAPGSGAGESSE